MRTCYRQIHPQCKNRREVSVFNMQNMCCTLIPGIWGFPIWPQTIPEPGVHGQHRTRAGHHVDLPYPATHPDGPLGAPRSHVYGYVQGACAQAAQGCMQDAPRACPVCPAHPGFRDRLGASQKASHNWDKGLASVFCVKHAAPLPISASRAAGQPGSPAASDRASTGWAPMVVLLKH